MSDEQLQAFLSLMMCSDPWPTTEDEHIILNDLANEESQKRGYDSWYVAYHELGK